MTERAEVTRMDPKEFGSFIALCRKNNSLTQAELGKKIGVTRKAVSRWETGIGFPDITCLQPLSEALGISMSELISMKMATPAGKDAAPDSVSNSLKAIIKIAAEDMRRKVALLIKTNALLLVFLAAFLCLWLALSGREPQTVWEIAGADPEEVSSIELVYHGAAVPLRPNSFKLLYDTFQNAEKTSISDKRSYIQSEYLIRFLDHEGNPYEISVYWFEPSFRSEDDISKLRFDIEKDGRIYHFYQTGSPFWTENRSRKSYDDSARYHSLPIRAKVDGLNALSYGTPDYLGSVLPWKELLNEADAVVLCRFADKFISYNSSGVAQFSCFEALQWFKEDGSSPVFLLDTAEMVTFSRNELSKALSPVTEPPFRNGSDYLLLLQKLPGSSFYYLLRRAYTAIAVEEGSLYPMYNTESHPFSGLTLEDIEAYLAEKR